MLLRPFLITLLLTPALLAAEDKISFNKDIRTIFSNSCFLCHGPDGEERQADLRLDTFEGATAVNKDGVQAIVPGDPGASEAFLRIISTDPEAVMPPPKHGDPFTAEQAEIVRKWIEQGAEYETHWAYQKPKRPALPKTDDSPEHWQKNPIDAFVYRELSKNKLKPSPESDRRTLARRVALDLTGVSPTAEEVAGFVSDESPDAYEKYVDQMLAKPTYGEHWTRMWLDLARYADSAGYADDFPRTIWAYRDYVIRSFNENKPFDQFTIEQLGGDLLPNATEEQRVATAFHRNTQTNNEGGTNDEEFRNVAVVDRVNTTFATWMGTTMACAQCHTHKYDPITHEEYFQIFDIFNQTADSDKKDEAPFISLFTGEQLRKKQALEQRIEELQKSISSKKSHPLRASAMGTSTLKQKNQLAAHHQHTTHHPKRQHPHRSSRPQHPCLRSPPRNRSLQHQGTKSTPLKRPTSPPSKSKPFLIPPSHNRAQGAPATAILSSMSSKLTRQETSPHAKPLASSDSNSLEKNASSILRKCRSLPMEGMSP